MTLYNLLKAVPDWARVKVWDTKKREYVYKGQKKAICADATKKMEVEFIDSTLEEDVHERVHRTYVSVYVHQKEE